MTITALGEGPRLDIDGWDRLHPKGLGDGVNGRLVLGLQATPVRFAAHPMGFDFLLVAVRLCRGPCWCKQHGGVTGHYDATRAGRVDADDDQVRQVEPDRRTWRVDQRVDVDDPGAASVNAGTAVARCAGRPWRIAEREPKYESVRLDGREHRR